MESVKKFSKKIIIIIFAFIVFAGGLGNSINVSAKEYKEGNKYTLSGTIQKVKYKHPNGTKLTAYIIKLKKKIKIKYYDYPGKMYTFKTNKLQLTPETKKLKKKVGKKVKIRGTLETRNTAWWYSYFILNNISIL